MARNSRETVSFRAIVPAGTTKIYESEIKGDGTVEKLFIRFYSGQQKALQVKPSIVFRTQEFMNMVRFAGDTDTYLSGDDDKLEYPLGIEVELKDKIVLDVTNTDSTNDYSLVVDVVVDYLAGKQRVI